MKYRKQEVKGTPPELKPPRKRGWTGCGLDFMIGRTILKVFSESFSTTCVPTFVASPMTEEHRTRHVIHLNVALCLGGSISQQAK